MNVDEETNTQNGSQGKTSGVFWRNNSSVIVILRGRQMIHLNDSLQDSTPMNGRTGSPKTRAHKGTDCGGALRCNYTLRKTAETDEVKGLVHPKM